MMLTELLKHTRPGDVISNTAWRKGLTFTVSVEFMKFHTGSGHDGHARNTCPAGEREGWFLANQYPSNKLQRGIHDHNQ